MNPFIGSEALAANTLTRGQLRWNYVALHPDVYLHKNAPRSMSTLARAAWLYTNRQGVVTGRAAAYLRGVFSVDSHTPVEIIGRHQRERPGIIMRNTRIDPAEIRTFGWGEDCMLIACDARIALDLARFLPRDSAVIHLDALARMTQLTYRQVADLTDRYRGVPHIRAAREALWLMDGGSQSPEETRLRLLLADTEFPRPRTNFYIGEDFDSARIAMGWERQKVAVAFDYNLESQHHVKAQTIIRQEILARHGWLEIPVLRQHHKSLIVYRVRQALLRRR